MKRLRRVLAVFAVLVAACGDSAREPELVGAVEIASVTDALPGCADTPSGGVSANTIAEEQYFARSERASELLADAGLQSARALVEDWIGLEFIDPPAQGFDDLLGLLPTGFCIDSIQFTPAPPSDFDVIDEAGETSELPELVNEVGVFLSGLPDPDSTEITLLLQERECADGIEMGDRLLGPDVFESDQEVLIAAGVAIQIANQACPGNPFTEVTIRLDSPLGDREIRNAVADEAIVEPT